MLNLDVESLFTNKPLKLINLTGQVVYDLLSAAAKWLLYIFDNSLYCQIDRVAMGSPLGSTLANAFLSWI